MKNMNFDLVPTTLDKDYKKKWNEHSNDFVKIVDKTGKPLNDNLYRIGGFGIGDEKYKMLLKYVEELYPDSITKIKKDKLHLAGKWVIVDNNGVEKQIFDSFKYPYINGGCVYSLDQKYYNIETGEFYCNAFESLSSSEYVFLNNKYDKDLSKRGVMRIKKSDGSFKIYK